MLSIFGKEGWCLKIRSGVIISLGIWECISIKNASFYIFIWLFCEVVWQCKRIYFQGRELHNHHLFLSVNNGDLVTKGISIANILPILIPLRILVRKFTAYISMNESNLNVNKLLLYYHNLQHNNGIIGHCVLIILLHLYQHGQIN